jgi:hypothetical protein
MQLLLALYVPTSQRPDILWSGYRYSAVGFLYDFLAFAPVYGMGIVWCSKATIRNKFGYMAHGKFERVGGPVYNVVGIISCHT